MLVDREGLGDVMLKAPFLRALRRTFPDHPVWWIATHTTSMANELRPMFERDVAKVVTHSGLDGRIGPPLSRLRAFPPFERVFDMRTRGSTVLFARFGLRHRGFYCCLPGYMFCDGRAPPGRKRPRHIAERALSLVSCASGQTADASGQLEAATDALTFAGTSLPEGRTYVGIEPGSRQANKNWPLDRYCQVAVTLATKGLTPVFFLGPQEPEAEAQIAAAAPDALIRRADPNLSAADGLDRLIAQGQRLALLLANDNGVGHLMGAAGVPVVSLFGPTDPARWRPVTPVGGVLRAQDFGETSDMAAIPPEPVTEAVVTMLARLGSPPS